MRDKLLQLGFGARRSSGSGETSGRARVVYLDHVANWSGGEIALARLLPALAGAIEPIVILADDGPLCGHLRDLGIAVEVVPMGRSLRDLRRSEGWTISKAARAVVGFSAYAVRLRGRLRQLAPAVVHGNSLKASVYGLIAAKGAGIPFVWHLRDRLASDYLPSRAAFALRLLARFGPDLVIANSEATRRTLMGGTPVCVVYDGVVPDGDGTRAGASYGASSEEHGLRIGMVGRISPWKGQHVFLEAFASAFRGKEGVEARIIGDAMFGEEEYAAELRERVRQLGIEAQVRFRGFRADVAAELASLDILVHASIVPEPFGMVIVEGMAAGLAVVASDAGGVREIVENGKSGLLVAAGDGAELGAVLVTLSGSKSLRRSLGAEAEVASRRFGVEAASSAIVEIYKVLVPGLQTGARGCLAKKA